MKSNLVVNGGMYQGTHYAAQPKGTSPLIKNAVYDIDGTNKGMLTNEKGFTRYELLNQGEIVLGQIPLDQEDCFLISLIEGVIPTERLLYFRNNVLTELQTRSDLTLDKKHEIEGVFDYNKLGERIAYWVDGYNNARLFNIDNPTSVVDINDISLFSVNISYPQLELEQISEGTGANKTGAYFVTAGYQDTDAVDWIVTSNRIDIVDDLRSNMNIEGRNYDGAPAGTDTTKSIQMRISNLDTSFTYLVIAITKVRNNIVSSAIINKLKIVGTEMLFSVSGTETEQDIDNEALLVNRVQYDAPKTIEIVDNQLVLGGLKASREIDLQIYANQIESGTLFKSILATDTNNNFKDEKFINNNTCFTIDEIYPLAIQGIRRNGTLTQPFHIPGRAITTTPFGGSIGDETDTILGSDPDNFLGEDAPYWKIYNTGKGGPNEDYFVDDLIVENGYWESSEIYPIGKDYPSELGEGTTPIRHHRINDHVMPLNQNDDGVSSYVAAGFVLKNIIIPKELRGDIVGFKILRGIRDSNNRSILAKPVGYYHKYLADGDDLVLAIGSGFNYDPPSSNIHYLNLFAPELQFEKPSISAGMYFKVKAELEGEVYAKSSEEHAVTLNSIVDVEDDNYTLIGAAYVGNNRIETVNTLNVNEVGVLPLFDNRGGQSLLAINSSREFTGFTNGDYGGLIGRAIYGYLKRNISNQYGRLEDIQYVETNAIILNLTDADFANDGTFIRDLGRGAGIVEITGGDTFIGNYSFNHHAYPFGAANPSFFFKSNTQYYPESTLNMNFRHEGTEAWEKYIPKTAIDDVLNISMDYDNVLLYNRDYSYRSNLRITLPDSDDAEFVEVFDNRVIASNKKIGEEKENPYRIFVASNYRDVPAYKGKITKLVARDNTLYVMTTGTTWNLHTNQQTLQASDANLYIGTGSIFAVKPTEVEDSKPGFGGCRNPKSVVTTPYGTFYIDYNTRSALVLYGNKISNISKQGLEPIFKKHTKFQLVEELNLLNIDYEWTDNPSNPDGIGWIGTYDPSYKRIIFTKRDYKPTAQVLNNIEGVYDSEETYEDGDAVIYNGYFYRITTVGEFSITTDFPFEIEGFDAVKLHFNDTTYFTNVGFSVSYGENPATGNFGWLAFHEYIPTNTFTLSDESVHSINNNITFDNGIYKHHTGNYGLFYYDDTLVQKLKDFVVEIVVNDYPTEKKILTNLILEVFASSGEDIEEVDEANEFFNKIWVYTKNQASGEITLVRNTNLFKAETEWRINEFYNIVSGIGTNIFKTKGIDKEFNILSFPVVKWYEESRFVDTYFVVRFIYNNLNNKKFSLYLVMPEFLPSAG